MKKLLLLALVSLSVQAYAINQIWTMRSVATGYFVAQTYTTTVTNLTVTTGISCQYPTATNCAPLVIVFTPLGVSSAAKNLSYDFGYVSYAASTLPLSAMTPVSTTAVAPAAANGMGLDPNSYWYVRAADTGSIPVQYNIYSVSNN